MRNFNVLWAVIIGTFFVVNFVMLQSARSSELLHGLWVTNVQLVAAAIAVPLLFRAKN